MNLIAEEQILIKDIFAVSVNPTETALLHLPQFNRDVSGFGPNASLVDHSTYFDSLLMERLQVPQTDILSYLEESWNRAEEAKSKPWNEGHKQQEFINYSIQIIKNFINLSLQQPQIFPEQVVAEADISGAPTKSNEIARKLMTHFERRGLNKELLDIVMSGNEKQFMYQLLEVLVSRQRFTTIIDSKAMFYLSTLVELLKDKYFKEAFLNLKSTKFLPDQGKGGVVFDTFTSLGLFMRLSLLGQKTSGHIYQEALSNQRFEERMNQQLGNDRITREKVRMYLALQSELNGKLLDVYKELMRKQSQTQFLEWNYRLLITNLGRMKLGHRIYNQENSNLSHDGILVNAYNALLGLCRVITNRQDDKWRNIDPNYFIYHEKASFFRVDPICSKPGPKIEGKKQFGTITEYFFLALQFLNVGVCGAMENFGMYNEMKKNMQRQLANVMGTFPQGHPVRKKAQNQINKIQCKILRYWILLNDDPLINQTIKLLTLLLQLLPRWMGVEYERLKDAQLQDKGTQLVYFMPELLLTLVSKYHQTMFSIKQNYLQSIGQEHIRQILELTCFLLSEQEIVTNPYIAAGYIEMIFSFLHDSKPGILHQQLRASPVVVRNFTFGLIRFYCGIANTGRSNQFYEKFKYRHYVNKIFTTLWTYEIFREDLKHYCHNPLFEKFINMILGDTNYSFDQTNENYEKYRKLLDKKAEQPLSQEDQQNEQMFERIMGANLEQVKSNLKLMRELSAWSPETFLTQADRRTAVPLLNNALRTFVDPASFSANRELMSKFKFESGRALSDLVQIYANLDINEVLSNEIVKDGRNYKKEYFSKALQRASNQHYTSINILEKFQDLINKLSTAENQEENQEIYGEIPEKYLCQLMSTLMCDPVKLPGSQYVVDRVNIKRHLLNDERDPFTRKPLKQSDLQSDKQLKDQIERWKKHRLQEIKKGGKEVKYGKIAENQKEVEEGTFESNLVIEDQ